MAMATKPTALRVQPEGIPDALKQADRWVCWRFELRRGSDRYAKILCQTNGTHAKSNDPTTWTTFDEVLAAYRRAPSPDYEPDGSSFGPSRPHFDGIGFVLGDGWAGIDLDHATNSQSAVQHVESFREAGVYF